MDLQWRMNNNHYKSVINIFFEEENPYTKQTKISPIGTLTWSIKKQNKTHVAQIQKKKASHTLNLSERCLSKTKGNGEV
jgi:hypothetical protein